MTFWDARGRSASGMTGSSATNARVVVPKFRICFCTLPSHLTCNKHPTTVA